MSWFNSWFGTPYYKLLYKNRDDSEAQNFITNLILELKIYPPKKVLDLACGNGRHSKHLASLGFQTYGCDITKESIDYAKNFESSSLQFFIQDMREKFPIQDFEVIVNLFTSFGYFDTMDENHQTLRNVEQALHLDGLFILDYFNANKVMEQLIPHEEKEIENIHFTINKSIDSDFIYKNIKVKDGIQIVDFQERVARFDLADFEEMFNHVGLNIINTYGNYNLEPFLEMNSDRLILVAEKKYPTS